MLYSKIILAKDILNYYYFIKQQDVITKICEIKSGIPQENILSPFLYLSYIEDLSVNINILLLHSRMIQHYLQ